MFRLPRARLAIRSLACTLRCLAAHPCSLPEARRRYRLVGAARLRSFADRQVGRPVRRTSIATAAMAGSRRNPLPPDQTAYGRFTELYELNRLHLKQILEEAAEAYRPRAPQTSKRSAMSTPVAWIQRRSTKHGMTPLQPELDRIAALQIDRRSAGTARRICTRIGVNAFFDFSAEPGLCRRKPGDLVSTTRVVLACRSATTTRALMPSPSSSANSMLTTCARSWCWPASPRRRQQKDADDGDGH